MAKCFWLEMNHYFLWVFKQKTSTLGADNDRDIRLAEQEQPSSSETGNAPQISHYKVL